MRVPLSLAPRVRRRRGAARELADRLCVAAAEVKAIERRGVPDVGRQPRPVPRRPRRSRPASTRTPTASSSAASTWGRASRGRSSAAPGTSAPGATVAVALPGAVLPGGQRARAGEAPRRGLRRDDPLRARARARPGPHRDHGPRARASPARRSPTSCRSSRPCSSVEPTGNRPDLLSVYGIAREVAALYDLELAPPPGRDPDAVGRRAGRRSTIDDFDGCPRYVGRLFRDVAIGALAAVAPRPADRCRHAADLERRRRDELRDARARQPAARVRLRDARRRADRRPAGAARARSCAPSTASTASFGPERPDDRRRRARGRDRRDHGRRGDRGRPTRRRSVLLEAANFEPFGLLPHVRAAAAPHRGLEPLGEGRRPLPRRRRRRRWPPS